MSRRTGAARGDIAIPAAVGLFVAFLALYPIGWLLYGSVRSGPPFEDTTFTLANYFAAYSDPTIGVTVANTLIFAVGQSVVALALGTALAWIVVRTNTPGRRAFEFLTLVLFLFPLIMAVFAWTMLLSPQKGLINTVLMSVFGLSAAPFDVYSMGGMIFVQSLYVAPLAFLIVAPAMTAIDSSLEEAARMSGAGPIRTTLKVGIPLTFPALASAFLLLFVVGLESFDVPQLLGAQEGIFTYPTLIYHAISVRFPPDYGQGTALATSLFAVTLLCVYVYRRSTARTERYQTLRGKGFRSEAIDLGRWRWLVCGLCGAFFFLTVFLPLAVLVVGSFLQFFGRFDMRIFERMSLANYPRLFTHPSLMDGLVNSLILSIAGGAVCVLLAAVVGFITVTSRLPGRGLLDGIAMLPISFPATVLGLALLWAWIVVPLPIYGTILILGIAYVTRYLPLALRTVAGGFAQIGQEMDEAARMSGAGWTRTFGHITLPLLRPALSAAWLLMFMIFIRELGMSVLLVGTGNPVLSVVMFDYYQSGELGLLATASVLLMALIVVTVWLAQRYLGIRFAQFGVG